MQKTRNYQWISLCCLIFTACSTGKDFPSYSADLSQNNTSHSVVLIGDTQRTGFWEFWRESNDAFRKVILDKIASEHPAFILHVGDVVFQGSSDSHWEEFDNNARAIREQGIPVFPVLGNHEYFGDNTTALANYFRHFPATENRQWYSFRFESVGYILLNSNFDELTADDINQQDEWYTHELASFQADSTLLAIVVACHQPPYTNSTVVDADLGVQEHFVSRFDSTAKAKLFVSGHCHSYEHFIRAGKHFLVTGGGGGPRQIVETDTSERQPIDVSPYKKKNIRPLHYCLLTAEQNGLRIRMMQLDEQTGAWSLGDTFFIQ